MLQTPPCAQGGGGEEGGRGGPGHRLTPTNKLLLFTSLWNWRLGYIGEVWSHQTAGAGLTSIPA